MVTRDFDLEPELNGSSATGQRRPLRSVDFGRRHSEVAAINEQLELHRRLLEVVARISTLIARSSDPSTAMFEGLGMIGEAGHFSRCLLLQRQPPPFPESAGEYKVVTEWCAKGVRSHHDCGTGTIAAHDAAEFIQKLRDGETFWCRVDEVDEPLRTVFQRMEIRTTGCAPIVVDHELWGALAFDDCVRDNPWDEPHIDALIAVANAISNALQTQHRAEKLALERSKAAQERVAELAKANAALRRSISRLADVPDVEAAMVEAISTAAEVIDSSGGALGLYLPEERGFRTLFQVVDGERVDLEGLSYHNRLYSLDEEPVRLAWEQFRSGDGVLWCPPDSCYLSEDSRRLIIEQGFGSSTLVALKRSAECIGYLGFFSRRNKDLLGSQRELIRAIADQISLMLELSRLARLSESAAIARARESAAHERAAELVRTNQALQLTTDTLAVAQGVAEIVPTVLRIVAEVFGSPTVGFYEVAGDIVYLRYWLTPDQILTPQQLMGLDIYGQDGVTRRLAEGFEVAENYLGRRPSEHQRAVVLNHGKGTSEPRFDEWGRLHRWDLELNVPIRVRDRTVAAICLYRSVEEPFTDAEISLSESLAKQIGLALSAARLADQEKEAAVALDREMQANRITNFLVKSFARFSDGADLSMALSSLITELARELGAIHVFLFRHDEAAKMLRMQLSYLDGDIRWGMSGDELPLFAHPFPDDITPAWKMMCEQRGLFTPDMCPIPGEEFAWPGVAEYASHFELSDVGHIVLFAGDCPIGSLGFALRGGKRMGPADKPFIEAAAQQAAIAIRMLDLGEKAKETAVARDRAAAAQARAVELARTNHQLDLRGRLLTASAKALEQLISAKDFISGVTDALRQIGQAAQLSRVQVLLETALPTGEFAHELVHEWWAEGLVSQKMMGYVLFPNSDLAQVINLLHKGERWWAKTEHWPSEVQPTFRELGIVWTGVVPIFVQQRYVGLIAFDQCNPDRDWSEAEIDALTIAARGIGAALSQERMAAQLVREREQAAQDRASELVKANHALRSSVDDLVTQTTTDGILTSLLKQAIDISAASSGAILRRVAGSEFEYVTIYADGAIRTSHDILAAGTNTEMRLASRVDPTGHFGRLTKGEARWREVNDEELAKYLPRSTSFHMMAGNKRIYDFPYKVAGQVFGYLGLAFADLHPPSETVQETIKALATQVGLALEFRRISEQVERAAVVEERNKFARDLHDTLAQGFAAILMQLGAAEQSGPVPVSLLPYLESIDDLARTNLAEARQTVNELRTSERVRDALLTRLSESARRLESAFASVIQIGVIGKQRSLPFVVEDELFLIAQESLTNAMKHAQATEVKLEVEFNGEGLRLRVKDNGSGFSANERGKPDHFGLQTMQERSQRISAKLTIISEPGFGTEILILWQDPSTNEHGY